MRAAHPTSRRLPSERALAVLLGCSVLVTLALGTAKLVLQRHVPPPHAGPEHAAADPLHNTYEGFVSIDQYCKRAERLRDWMRGEPGARETLRMDLTTQGHPTVLIVPLVLALASQVTGSIPITFAFLSAGAFLAQVALVRRLARALAERAGSAAPRCAALGGAILVAAHVDSARSAVQLLLDPFAGALATACVLLALTEHPRGSRTARWLFGVQLVGPFLKLSYLPFLAAPALVALLTQGPGRWRAAWSEALRFGLVPVIPALLYLLVVPTWSAFTGEMGIAATYSGLSAPELRGFALEMALWFQVLPLALLLARRSAFAPATRATLAVMLLFLASVWALRLPDDYRLYLPALGLWCAASAPSVVAASGHALVPVLAGYALVNAAVALVGLLSSS